MPPDDEERKEETPEPEPEPEEEAPAEVDPRDARIAELEAALTEVTTNAEARAQALFTARVDATGLTLDPTALPYDAALLDDSEALSAAIEALLVAKPLLRRIAVTGDVDQGAKEEVAPFSLMGAMKSFT
jgi:hypothetical protein